MIKKKKNQKLFIKIILILKFLKELENLKQSLILVVEIMQDFFKLIIIFGGVKVLMIRVFNL